MLKEICGAKRDEVTRESRKLHNEELNDLKCSPISVRVMKSGRMKWVGHLEFNGGRRGGYRVLGGIIKRGHLEDPGVDGRKILRRIFMKWDGALNGLIWLRIGQVAGTCDCGNGPSSSIKCGEFLD